MSSRQMLSVKASSGSVAGPAAVVSEEERAESKLRGEFAIITFLRSTSPNRQHPSPLTVKWALEQHLHLRSSVFMFTPAHFSDLQATCGTAPTTRR
jgi:hypothetical protein